jgi:hypothetical protein
MRTFTLAECLIVVTGVALASAALRSPESDFHPAPLLAAVAVGVALAGPPLLAWRRRRKTFEGPWGAGELAWFFLGLYFLPLVAWNLAGPGGRLPADLLLLIACLLSGSAVVALATVFGLRVLLRLLGTTLPSRPHWFALRWTNLVGLALLAAFVVGYGIAMLL